MGKLVLGLALLLAPLLALGHGGEDHGDQAGSGAQAAARAPGSAIYFPKESQFLLGIRTARAAPRKIESRLEVPGKVVPRTDRHAQVSAPVAGRILAARGRLPLVGQRVRRGEVLAILEQSLAAPETAQLATERIKSEAAVARARAALEQTRRDLARAEALKGVVADKEAQQAELAVQLATGDLARVERERAVYAGSGAGASRLTRFPLASPIDGVIVEAAPTIGEQVEPSRALYTIVDSSVVWVEASVFADDVGRVEAAREALVHVDAYPERYFAAKLFNLSQMVDEATRTVKAIFEIKNADGKLRPGSFATVAIGGGGAGGGAEMLAVPEAAVVEADGRSIVYLHSAPEEFVAREVALGPRDGGYRALRRGLEEGDRVVTSGVYQIRSAMGRGPP